MDGFELSKDDLVLTLKELRGQYVQLMLQKVALESSISEFDRLVADFGD